ncbi:MAG: transporter substrate-binding domain-containing protein [Hahellaceae bacterium]|jgi:arginine/ornithine transport system substrate-binding protein|nr:transporter substrate-binding domain-containing protein [Hahellaceae bacterium]MCP5211003.1 transporter substrate-binding domain-containing protein [Hahellaceae bacterium]
MKKLLVAVSCALSLAASGAMAKDWKEIKIAVDVPYEPFEYKNPDGTLTGFEVDLGNAVCKDIGAKCEWIPQAWDGIIPGLLARKYDAIMSSMSITEERAEKVLFSEGYYNTPSAWFGKADQKSLDVTSEAALKGKTVGVQRGTLQDNYVSENFGDVVDIKRYTTADDLVLDLKGGRLDLVFLDYPVGEQTIIDDAAYAVIGGNVKVGQGVGVAFRKRDTDLAEKFNASLKKLKNDGTYDAIMNKYFKYDIKI